MKLLKDTDVKSKKVLVRVDFNVNVENGRVLEDYRIRAALPTIKYLLENGAEKVILISHMGRPEGKYDPSFSLDPIREHLSKLIKEGVDFISSSIQEDYESVKKKIEKSRNKLIVLDNIRFYKEEEENDRAFAKKLSGFGDIFVEDAFGVCHRAHASTVGITEFLPSLAGLLVQKEVEILSGLFKNPKRPLTFIIGGAKISTKLPIIEKFMRVADNICIGGALANTVLKAKGISVGKSLVEEEMVGVVKNLNLFDTRLHLPVDIVSAKDKDREDSIHVESVGAAIMEDEAILDIGPDTVALFSDVINRSMTVVWNGPVGYLENRVFARGTVSLAKAMAKATQRGVFTVIGGGDTYLILEELGLMGKISFVSTGGGAMLDFLAKGTLPGIDVLK